MPARKVRNLQENTTTLMVARVAACSGRRLTPAEIDAMQDPLRIALIAMLRLGANNPQLVELLDDGVDDVGNGDTTELFDTRPGFKRPTYESR
jgi:hypothetical protein